MIVVQWIVQKTAQCYQHDNYLFKKWGTTFTRDTTDITKDVIRLGLKKNLNGDPGPAQTTSTISCSMFIREGFTVGQKV